MIRADWVPPAAAAAAVLVVTLRLRPCSGRPPSSASLGCTRIADESWRRVRRSRRRLLIAAGAVALLVVAGPLALAAGVAAAAVRPRFATARAHRRSAAAIASGFPDFVDLLVLTVRAGCTPLQAFQTLARTTEPPIQGALVAVVRAVADGGRFADALPLLPRQLGTIAQPLADSLALADRHGSPLGPMLDRLADDARAHRRRIAEATARQLPVRLSFPLVGCTLPSFVLLTVVPLMAGTFSSLRGLRP